MGVLTPVGAGAFLPDGRVYEQVSPANKNGNVVGINVGGYEGEFSLASATGNAVVYGGSGAMGSSPSSGPGLFVSRRSPGTGWATERATPPQLPKPTLFGPPIELVPSADFSRFVFSSNFPYSPEQPLEPNGSVNLYFTVDPFQAPVWIGKPAIADPVPRPGFNKELRNFIVAGATPSLETVYFTYSGTLISQDETRAPYVRGGEGGSGAPAPWGFYEWHAGALAPAGVLPDGTLSQFGAVPAAVAGFGLFLGSSRKRTGSLFQASSEDNQVSEDGSRAFFVSPDPVASTVIDTEACAQEPPCTSEPPELYVREALAGGGHRVVLVSRSQLSGHVGSPAPDGPVAVENASGATGEGGPGEGAPGATFVYGSPDGSRAFFASTDRLTEAAPEGNAVKEYEFDLASEELTYLPGVIGPVVASVRDGSRFVFENTATATPELDLWTSAPGGGAVRRIVQLSSGKADATPARMSVDGSVFLFQTSAAIAGFNNAGGFRQIYRYDAASERIACVSCPPEGVTPSGSPSLSHDDDGGFNGLAASTIDTRGMSADGSRVFFDTPDPLVSQDTNGQRDVYEWEGGRVYPISSGTSPQGSFYADSSASGGDVFFVTTSGIAPGDVDGADDVYDARVPQPGDNPPPLVVPCQGEVCQGPPSVPQLFGAPGSATFNGAGNTQTPPSPAAVHKAKKKSRGGRRVKHRRRASSKKRGKAFRSKVRRAHWIEGGGR
jgi:hypothetical protein